MYQKTALITGASRGIGKAIAIALAKDHYNLILTCIYSKEALKELQENLEEQYHITCRILIGDVSDFSFITKIFREIDSLDVLINNAGISYIGLLQDMPVDDWHHVMQTNLDSVFYTSKLSIPIMLQKKSGKIINISSIWGASGASMEVAYSASKGAVNAYTKALAKELAPSNIQVNAIACGVIDTDMNRCFSDEERQSIIDDIPCDRLGQPEEVGSLVCQMLMFPSYFTGQIITIDGGYL